MKRFVLALTFAQRGTIHSKDVPLILQIASQTALEKGFVMVQDPVGRCWATAMHFLMLTFEPLAAEEITVQSNLPQNELNVEYLNLDVPLGRGWRRTRGESWNVHPMSAEAIEAVGPLLTNVAARPSTSASPDYRFPGQIIDGKIPTHVKLSKYEISHSVARVKHRFDRASVATSNNNNNLGLNNPRPGPLFSLTRGTLSRLRIILTQTLALSLTFTPVLTLTHCSIL